MKSNAKEQLTQMKLIVELMKSDQKEIADAYGLASSYAHYSTDLLGYITMLIEVCDALLSTINEISRKADQRVAREGERVAEESERDIEDLETAMATMKEELDDWKERASRKNAALVEVRQMVAAARSVFDSNPDQARDILFSVDVDLEE